MPQLLPFSRRLLCSTVSSKATLFNRSKELDNLCGTLKVKPTFSIVSAPVNSGKSTLLVEVMHQLRKQSRTPSIVNLNLKSLTFRDVASFCSVIMKDLGSWLTASIPILKGSVKAQGSYDGFASGEIAIEGMTDSSSESIMGFSKELNIISKSLPEWSWLTGTDIPRPILY